MRIQRFITLTYLVIVEKKGFRKSFANIYNQTYLSRPRLFHSFSGGVKGRSGHLET